MAVPLDPVLAPFDRIFRALAVSGAGALVIALVVSIILTRGLTRPVHRLVTATGRVARGDYSARVDVDSRDELGDLARSFNGMTQGLQLKEQYRGVLDKVVSRDVAEELLKGDVVLGGETREVTVVFADIEGFTTLTEGMEPQGVIGLLNECMERLGAAVEGEGGVVDKYVGDGLMAVFGAPVAADDDPVRAVRAAVRMQEAMAELNRRRAGRREDPIHLNIGISTGEAVAGNMGSPSRLNYTVLGETVNLAARLSEAAKDGETLMSSSTRRRVADAVRTRPLGARRLKGFSSDQDVYALDGLDGGGRGGGGDGRDDGGSGRDPGRTANANAAGLGSIVLLALLTGAGGTAGQGGGLPALRDLGLSYISPSGFLQVDLSGRLDLEGYLPQDEPAWIIPATEAFVAGRARLFVDVFAGDHVYGLVELRADRGEEPTNGDLEGRLDQAFLRITAAALPLAVQLGRFASPFGGYAQRHHTDLDPFIRPPLMYDHRTMVVPSMAPAGPEAFVGWKDDPDDMFRPRGAPAIWGAPYQWGAMLMGGLGDLSVRLAAMNSAPSSEPEAWAWNAERLRNAPSFVANMGYQPAPELRLEASYDRGPYMEPTFSGTLDPGRHWKDYVQEIWGLEAVFRRGRTGLRGEVFADRWDVPNVPDDAWDFSYYLEGEVTLAPGLFLAARFAEMRFNRIASAEGVAYGRYGDDIAGNRWDFDTRRLQIGAGYRLLPNVELRAEYMLNHTTRPGGDPADNLAAIQWWWQF